MTWWRYQMREYGRQRGHSATDASAVSPTRPTPPQFARTRRAPATCTRRGWEKRHAGHGPKVRATSRRPNPNEHRTSKIEILVTAPRSSVLGPLVDGTSRADTITSRAASGRQRGYARAAMLVRYVTSEEAPRICPTKKDVKQGVSAVQDCGPPPPRRCEKTRR